MHAYRFVAVVYLLTVRYIRCKNIIFLLTVNETRTAVIHWTYNLQFSRRSHHPGSHNTPLASSAQELCSRLWCWCASVLMALLPATSPNSAFLLQVVSISGQPRRAYYKFPDTGPWSAGGTVPSQDRFCGTVFRLLCGDRRWQCTLSSDNSRPVCSTSDVLMNRRNISTAARPAL